MYTVGFVDNSYELFDDYCKRLKRHDIELLGVESKQSQQDIVDWVLAKNIKCLMIDFDLQPHFVFDGTDLIVYINSIMPDLPCMIMTGYPEQSLNTKLVVQNMIESREMLHATDISPLVNKLKQAVEVYENRLKMRSEEFEKLATQKRQGSLTALEQERYEYLYKILRAYGEIDELPTDMLKPEIGEKMDSLIEKLENILHQKK